MAARHIARNGEAEAGATGLRIARIIKPIKRAKHFFQSIFGNADAIIIDKNCHRVFGFVNFRTKMHHAGMAARIIDQIIQAATKSI